MITIGVFFVCFLLGGGGFKGGSKFQNSRSDSDRERRKDRGGVNWKKILY